MLIDLTEAESIPDVLVIIQSAFKLLIEQLRKASEKAAQSSIELQDIGNRFKNEHQTKFNQQLHQFLREFHKHVCKTVNLLIITKFETLSNMADPRQVLPIMQHFVDFPLTELLRETENSLGYLVGEAGARSLLSKVEELVKQLFLSLTGSRTLTLSKMNIVKSVKDADSQTEAYEPTPKKAPPTMVTKSVQSETSSRTVGVQVEDDITNKKLELLIVANKRLKSDRDANLSEMNVQATQFAKFREENTVELARLRQRCIESETMNKEFISRIDRIIKENQQLKEQLRLAQSESQEAKLGRESLEIEIKTLRDKYFSLDRDFTVQKEQLINSKQRSLEKSKQESFANESKLTKEIEATKQNYNKMFEELKKVMEKTDREVSSIRGELSGEREAKLKLESEVGEQARLVEELQAKLLDAGRQLERAGSEKNEASELLKSLKKANQELSARLEQQLAADSQSISESQLEISRLKQQLDSKNERVASVERELAELASRVLQAEQAVLKEKDLRSAADSQLTRAQATAADLTRRLEQAEAKTESGVLELEAVSKERASLRQETESLKSQKSEESSRAARLESTLAQVKETKDQEQLELRQLLAKKSEEFEAALGQKAQEYAKISSELEQQASLHQVEVQSLKSRVSSLQDQTSGQNELKLQIDGLRVELAAKDRTILDLKESEKRLRGVLEERVSQAAQAEKSLEAVSSQKKASEEALASLKAELKKKEKEVSDLSQKVRELQAAVQQKESVEGTNSQLASKVGDLNREVAALREKSRSAESQAAELQAAVQKRGSEKQALEAKLEQRELQVTALQEERARLEGNLADFSKLKAELIKISVQHAQKGEELASKETTIASLQASIDQLKETFIQKSSEFDKVDTSLRKVIEEQQRKMQEAEREKQATAKQVESQRQHEAEEHKKLLQRELEAQKARLDAVVLGLEQKNASLLNEMKLTETGVSEEKRRQISSLEQQVSAQQQEIAQAASSSLREKAELQSKLASLEKELSTANEERKSLLALKEKFLSDIKQAEERLSASSAAFELQTKKHRELEAKCHQNEEFVKVLVSQNEALTAKLKNLAKSQYSLPRSNSNQKLDNPQVPPTNPSNHSKPLPAPVPTAAEKQQAGIQVSSFDKQTKSATSSQVSSHRDKENLDLNIPRQPHSYGLKKPLEERPQDKNVLQDYSNLPTPHGSATTANNVHSIVISSPAKQRMRPSSSLSGLHQLEEDQREEDFLKGDDYRQYSSRYSRVSRNSRNSKRSPTPSKYPAEYNSHPGLTQPFSHQ